MLKRAGELRRMRKAREDRPRLLRVGEIQVALVVVYRDACGQQVTVKGSGHDTTAFRGIAV